MAGEATDVARTSMRVANHALKELRDANEAIAAADATNAKVVKSRKKRSAGHEARPTSSSSARAAANAEAAEHKNNAKRAAVAATKQRTRLMGRGRARAAPSASASGGGGGGKDLAALYNYPRVSTFQLNLEHFWAG